MATQWQRWLATAVLATGGLGLAACGGGSDDDKSSAGGKSEDLPAVSTSSPTVGSGSKIEVVGKEFSYSPAKLTLKAGQASTIALKNTGSIEHDLAVSDPSFKLTVAPGNTSEKELKVDKPGTYEFYCTVAGHKDAGMKGELTVE